MNSSPFDSGVVQEAFFFVSFPCKRESKECENKVDSHFRGNDNKEKITFWSPREGG